jgi:aquaporin Z
MPISKRCLAEFLGTLWLVLGGCGSAVLAGKFLDANESFNLGIGFLGVALAFGLTLLTMAYAIGHISGCHLNPAVSFGLWAAGRFPGGELLPYILAQVLGAILGAGIIYLIAIGQPDFAIDPNTGNPLATNGFGVHSPGGFGLFACFICEVVMTFFFLMIILGATDFRAPAALAPVAIGMALTLVHLISIPVTNTSVNPARSTGPALFVGGPLFGQLWLFWVAPILGALIAGWLYHTFFAVDSEKERRIVGVADRV